MNEHGLPTGATGLLSAESLTELFESAWKTARDGEEGPKVESFLLAAEESVRPGLEKRLRKIADEYEQKRQASRLTCGNLSDSLVDGDPQPENGPGSPSPLGSSDPPNVGGPPESASPTGGESAVLPFGETVQFDSRDPLPDGFPSCFAQTMDHAGPLPPEPPADGPTLAGVDTSQKDFEVRQLAPPPDGRTLGEVGASGQPKPEVPGYEILGVLGRGGMGVVYKARQIGLNRLVALKMVLAGAHAGAQQLGRFQVEAEAVARLDHPNIVQIYEVGKHEGLPYFSLEFVSGGCLADAIAGKLRPPKEVAALVEHLALAMAVAHRHGVIHRDLKPANVLLTLEGTPKITDFGLAKTVESESGLTNSGALMGTPAYMSPEQAWGETHTIGPPSDLYSLGAILYELLTGRPPFLAPSVLETIDQVRNQEPVPPRRLQPKAPKDLETICLKCLQKEPSKRYANCEELAKDLHRFRSGELIRARPVGKTERLWRWCRRNPRLAVLSAAIALLVCLVGLSLGAVTVRLNRERETASQTRTAATERIEQAQTAISGGDSGRARDLLGWSDPVLESSPDLQDLRDRRDTLRAQVAVYAEFKQLLDDARFDCRFGSRPEKQRGRQTCVRLLALYDQIEQQTGAAADGLPPLNGEQLQLFKEDAFEAFLVAALVERELATDEAGRREATRRAIEWLNRAEKILPGTRALYVQRSACWGALGEKEADRADVKRAEAITPTSAVDRFWRGFAEHLRGEEARRNGNAKAAEAFFRNEIAEYAAFVQMRPDNFWGYFNWAVCLVGLGDLDDAAIGFTTCIRIREDFPWPYNNRGTVHLRKERYDQAVQDYNFALARNPNYVEAWANRGTAYAKQGKTDLALADLGRAIELNPNYADAYEQRAEVYRVRKQYDKALADFATLLKSGRDPITVLPKRAALYREMNRLEDALRDYDQLVTLRPDDAQTIYTRAGVHLARRDYGKVDADLSRVLVLVSRAVDVWRDRAIVRWQHLKNFDAAITDWEELIKIQPKNHVPYRCIGVIHLGRREYEPALAALASAIALKPDYAEAIWARAQIYLWQGKHAEALRELDRLVARVADEPPETLNVRGDVYRAMGRLDEAAADYHWLIRLRPKDPNAHISLAHIYQKQGKPQDAKACYDQLVAADPRSAVAYLRRAEFRRDNKEFELALADCAEAAKLSTEKTLPELVTASVEAASGRYREAVARAEAALKNAPPNDGHVLYAAACVWSLASGAAAADGPKTEELANDYADRAASSLAATLDKGFHDLLYPEHNRMADDVALDPVRQHPQVCDLLRRGP
jgi:serine/threonine protein kinase/tetratricopeptide (TPR) repeat protein